MGGRGTDTAVGLATGGATGVATMPNRPQFSLRSILIIVAVLSVPLGMMVSPQALLGVLLLLPVAGGCVGYLVGGRDKVVTGVLIGVIVFVGLCLIASMVFPIVS